MQPTSTHVILALCFPDRPGALGAVASRIGAVGGDITDVEIASRRAGVAEDVLHVDLPPNNNCDMVSLLLAEVGAVDGVIAPSVTWPAPGCCVLQTANSD